MALECLFLMFEYLLQNSQVTYPAHSHPPSASLDDLPRNVVSTMRQGSVVMSMDFHPAHHTLLAGQSIYYHEELSRV